MTLYNIGNAHVKKYRWLFKGNFINENKDFGDFQTFAFIICIDIKGKLT